MIEAGKQHHQTQGPSAKTRRGQVAQLSCINKQRQRDKYGEWSSKGKRTVRPRLIKDSQIERKRPQKVHMQLCDDRSANRWEGIDMLNWMRDGVYKWGSQNWKICHFAKIIEQSRIFAELRVEKNTNPDHSSSFILDCYLITMTPVILLSFQG